MCRAPCALSLPPGPCAVTSPLCPWGIKVLEATHGGRRVVAFNGGPGFADFHRCPPPSLCLTASRTVVACSGMDALDLAKGPGLAGRPTQGQAAGLHSAKRRL